MIVSVLIFAVATLATSRVTSLDELMVLRFLTGIGLGAAQRFVEEGAFVYLFGRRQEQLDAAVAKLGTSARRARLGDGDGRPRPAAAAVPGRGAPHAG